MNRSVAGIAFEEGKVFIARRKMGGDLGGKWEFPGGKAEAGETDADALRREFFEEFGAAVTPGPLLASGEFSHDGRKFALNAYRIFFDSRDLCLTEHDEWRWAALEEIEALDFAGSDRLLLPALQVYFKENAGIEDRQA
jgi:8-oxo-dGTP diphosphatase